MKTVIFYSGGGGNYAHPEVMYPHGVEDDSVNIMLTFWEAHREKNKPQIRLRHILKDRKNEDPKEKMIREHGLGVEDLERDPF